MVFYFDWKHMCHLELGPHPAFHLGLFKTAVLFETVNVNENRKPLVCKSRWISQRTGITQGPSSGIRVRHLIAKPVGPQGTAVTVN